MSELIYNPEGSALRRDQMELLRMVQIFDKICKENDIQWWLSSGTLLGAARHQGFIPWDDDMDVVLLKKDYKKLEKILCKYKSEEYVYQCKKTDVNYVLQFGKFRKKEGSVQSKNPRHQYYKWKGIGFDVFAIEKTNYFAANVACGIYSKFQRFAGKISYPTIRNLVTRMTQILCDYLVFPILRIIGFINPHQEYHYVLGTGWAKHTFLMKNTFPLSHSNFEGVSLPVPKDMDSYLTLVYGDWRKIPSSEEIKKSIHCQEYRDEIYGKGQ